MRPLELRLRNFRSFFGDGHAFDFRDRHLIGIVGPIGAGKSSLLDAIAYALYGRTPRVARSTKTLIHQRADHAAVALRFEVDGQIWEAVRQLRRSGQSQHALYLLEADEPDPENHLEKIVMEGEVNERIEQLLGFDYDAFGRSVLLAQGEFAEFLTSRPSERDKVLKGVFGHERIDAMRELAKAKVKDSNHELEKLGIRLEQAEAALGRIAGRREALAAAATRLTALEEARPEVDEISASIDTAETRLRSSTQRLEELGRLATSMPDATKSEETITAALRSRERRAELAARLDEAHQAVAAAEASVKSDEFLARSDRLKAAADLVVRLEGLEGQTATARARRDNAETRQTEATALAEQAGQTLERAEARVGTATTAAATAGDQLAEAEHALLDARHADMAASLRVELRAGEACPVCDQPVHDLPEASVSTETADAEKAVLDRRELRTKAETELREATASVEAARTALEAASGRIGEAEKELDSATSAHEQAKDAEGDARAQIAAALGEGDPAERLEIERLAIDEMGAGLEAARKVVEDVRHSLDESIAAEQEADRSLSDLRTRVVALATQLDGDTDLPEDDPAALRSSLQALRDAWRSVTETLESSVETDRADLVAQRGRLAELGERLEFEGDIKVAVASVTKEVELLENEIERDEELVAASSDLIETRARLEDQAGSFRRLAGDLTDAKFIRFLLDEERAALAELGSEHFQRLSSGRYRFTEDGTFQVVDLTAADVVRKADSLSGGETFLASLGLALGLSEMVGRTGGRLDAFFLDEGFGTLDADHLDLAMEGIEALVTEHAARLVVVVSHVAELRHRLEDLIVLDKDPVTGDSVVLSGAAR